MKVTTGCFNWSHPSIPHSSSSSSSKRRSFTDVSFVCRQSSIFGTKLNRSHSYETLISSNTNKCSIKRILSSTFDSHYSSNEYPPDIHDELHELTVRFQLSDDDVTNSDDDVTNSDDDVIELHNSDQFVTSYANWFGDMMPASVEWKAKSLGLPFSLRMIQKKKQLEEGLREVGEYAYCSMKKAFSSMVFIIRELQSYTLQMREVLFVEDLQGILMRVQKEMNASFVWLFQQVFSHTPNLMVCVMILLANYSVYAMSNQVGVAVLLPSPTVETTVSIVGEQMDVKFDSLTVKTCSITLGGKTTSIGGINSGGGKYGPVSGGTDGDGKYDQQNEHQTIVPDGGSSSTLNPASTSEESVSGEVSEAEELGLWNSIVAEAETMQGMTGVDGLDSETMRRFVSPVTVKLEDEADTEVYLKREFIYQMGLLEEPDNPLMLANYAQFLYLFYHDHK
ncbi:hypothetical protein M8C21_025167, partial [Ambrosia artemisiifolia]